MVPGISHVETEWETHLASQQCVASAFHSSFLPACTIPPNPWRSSCSLWQQFWQAYLLSSNHSLTHGTYHTIGDRIFISGSPHHSSWWTRARVHCILGMWPRNNVWMIEFISSISAPICARDLWRFRRFVGPWFSATWPYSDVVSSVSYRSCRHQPLFDVTSVTGWRQHQQSLAQFIAPL